MSTLNDEARRVDCKPIEVVTMQQFLSMKTKIGGLKKNSKVEVEVNDTGHDIRCAGNDDGEQNIFASLQVRILDADEQFSFDFQETKTISEIVSELRGNLVDLNDLPLDTVLKACRKFSGHSHSVIPDEVVPVTRAVLFDVSVDIDSVLFIFKRRNSDALPKTIDEILKNLSNTLDASWAGFHICTNYCPNNKWIKAIPCNKKGGPTIEPFEDGGRFRIHLPTPPGSEVLQVYLYSPRKLNYGNFVQCVQDIIHECACTLLQESGQYRLFHELKSTHDEKTEGGRPCAVPGGYKLALGTALRFLEEHPEGALVLETYNCKQKGLKFKVPAKGFGTDPWLNKCVFKIKQGIKGCASIIQALCRLDRLAELDPTMSSIGFGFELR